MEINALTKPAVIPWTLAVWGREVCWEMRGEAEHVGMIGAQMSLTCIGTTSQLQSQDKGIN